jgi:hypothetical protein
MLWLPDQVRRHVGVVPWQGQYLQLRLGMYSLQDGARHDANARASRYAGHDGVIGRQLQDAMGRGAGTCKPLHQD